MGEHGHLRYVEQRYIRRSRQLQGCNHACTHARAHTTAHTHACAHTQTAGPDDDRNPEGGWHWANTLVRSQSEHGGVRIRSVFIWRGERKSVVVCVAGLVLQVTELSKSQKSLHLQNGVMRQYTALPSLIHKGKGKNLCAAAKTAPTAPQTHPHLPTHTLQTQKHALKSRTTGRDAHWISRQAKRRTVEYM